MLHVSSLFSSKRTFASTLPIEAFAGLAHSADAALAAAADWQVLAVQALDDWAFQVSLNTPGMPASFWDWVADVLTPFVQASAAKAQRELLARGVAWPSQTVLASLKHWVGDWVEPYFRQKFAALAPAPSPKQAMPAPAVSMGAYPDVLVF